MNILVRAVVTGFGLSLGAAIYKRVEKRLGMHDEDKSEKASSTVTGDGAQMSPG